MAAVAERKPVSFAAEDSREAGSLPTDFDGTIIEARFTKEAPDNYTAEGNPIFAVLTIERAASSDLPENERKVGQSYSLGAKAGDEFTISDDNYELYPNDDSIGGIRKGSKFDLVKTSLENVGVSGAIMKAGTLKKWIGIIAHWKRVEDSKLLGKAREFQNDQRKNKRPPETLVAVKLLDKLQAASTPPAPQGQGTASAPPVQTAGQQASAPSSAPEGDLDTATMTYLFDVLSEAKDNTIQRPQATLLVSKKAIKDPRRQDIGRRVAQEEFLLAQQAAGMLKYNASSQPQTIALG